LDVDGTAAPNDDGQDRTDTELVPFVGVPALLLPGAAENGKPPNLNPVTPPEFVTVLLNPNSGAPTDGAPGPDTGAAAAAPTDAGAGSLQHTHVKSLDLFGTKQVSHFQPPVDTNPTDDAAFQMSAASPDVTGLAAGPPAAGPAPGAGVGAAAADTLPPLTTPPPPTDTTPQSTIFTL